MISLKEKIEGLNSLLEFMDVDLSGLSEQQKLYWAATFAFLYKDKDAQIALEKAKPSDVVIPIPRVSKVDLSVVQNALRGFVEDILKQPVNPLPKFDRRLFAGKDGFEIQSYSPIKLSGANDPNLDTLTNTVAILIERLPPDCIKKCEECGRHFIHVSKKVKIYCSSKCSFKHLSRKRREELKKHPRKYKAFLKNQKEKMKKIYEEKKKAEFGPNVVIRRNGKRPKRKED